ncbi:hypothetical protein ABPG75_001973 [Micractinium tetrahymenae]
MPSRRRAPAARVDALLPLPADALQAIFSKLESDDDRRSALATCKAWHAAFSADPRLWPAIVLRAPPAHCRAYVLQQDGCDQITVHLDAQARAALLDAAGAVNRRAVHARLEGFRDMPEVLLGLVSVLPPSLTRLELPTRCTGPLPTALARCLTRLADVSITGNGAEMSWSGVAGAALIPKLSQLRLCYSRPQYAWPAEVEPPARTMLALRMPDSLAAALQGASRLRTLDLVLRWSTQVAQLLALPSLRELSLGLLFVEGRNEGEAAAELAVPRGEVTQAVAALHEALHLTALRLSSDTGPGFDETMQVPDEELDWIDPLEARDAMQLPSLAGLPGLVSLRVRRGMHLPADWRSLTGLTALECDSDPIYSGDSDNLIVDWASPLGALAALHTLHIGQPLRSGRLPASVCELPQLRELLVNAEGGALHLPAALSRLSGLTRLEVRSGVMRSVPATVRRLASLRVLDLESYDLQELPAGPYLAGLTELRLPFFRGSKVPGSLAGATALRTLEMFLPRTLPPADVQRLAALPALRVSLAALPALREIVHAYDPRGLGPYWKQDFCLRRPDVAWRSTFAHRMP